MRVSGGLLMVLQEGNHSIYFNFIFNLKLDLKVTSD